MAPEMILVDFSLVMDQNGQNKEDFHWEVSGFYFLKQLVKSIKLALSKIKFASGLSTDYVT